MQNIRNFLAPHVISKLERLNKRHASISNCWDTVPETNLPNGVETIENLAEGARLWQEYADLCEQRDIDEAKGLQWVGDEVKELVDLYHEAAKYPTLRWDKFHDPFIPKPRNIQEAMGIMSMLLDGCTSWDEEESVLIPMLGISRWADEEIFRLNGMEVRKYKVEEPDALFEDFTPRERVQIYKNLYKIEKGWCYSAI